LRRDGVGAKRRLQLVFSGFFEFFQLFQFVVQFV
jgi:hypothetical protein